MSFHVSSQYGELRLTSGWDLLASLGQPSKFQRVSRLGNVTARHLVVGISQTLRRWTEGTTCVPQGDHHVGHWPTFLVLIFSTVLDWREFVLRCPQALIFVIWRVNTDSREPAGVESSMSSAPLTNTNDPATSSQNASEFDFNEFFRIDSVNIRSRWGLLTKRC